MHWALQRTHTSIPLCVIHGDGSPPKHACDHWANNLTLNIHGFKHVRALSLAHLSKRPSYRRGHPQVIRWRSYYWTVVIVVVEARTEIEISIELEINVLIQCHSDSSG